MGGPTSESAEPASEEPSPDEPSLGTTASRGFLWANLGIFTRYVTALILAAVLARVLSPVDYAVMVTLMLITFYFDNALDLGMGAALVYEQEEGVSERVQVAFTANVGLGAVLAALLLEQKALMAASRGREADAKTLRARAQSLLSHAKPHELGTEAGELAERLH